MDNKKAGVMLMEVKYLESLLEGFKGQINSGTMELLEEQFGMRDFIENPFLAAERVMKEEFGLSGYSITTAKVYYVLEEMYPKKIKGLAMGPRERRCVLTLMENVRSGLMKLVPKKSHLMFLKKWSQVFSLDSVALIMFLKNERVIPGRLMTLGICELREADHSLYNKLMKRAEWRRLMDIVEDLWNLEVHLLRIGGTIQLVPFMGMPKNLEREATVETKLDSFILDMSCMIDVMLTGSDTKKLNYMREAVAEVKVRVRETSERASHRSQEERASFVMKVLISLVSTIDASPEDFVTNHVDIDAMMSEECPEMVFKLSCVNKILFPFNHFYDFVGDLEMLVEDMPIDSQECKLLRSMLRARSYM